MEVAAAVAGGELLAARVAFTQAVRDRNQCATQTLTSQHRAAIQEIMRDAVTAVANLKADWFHESTMLHSPLIVLAQRIVCTFMLGSGSTFEAAEDRREAYNQLLAAHERKLMTRMALLDAILLTATLPAQVDELLILFTDLVADGELRLLKNALTEGIQMDSLKPLSSL